MNFTNVKHWNTKKYTAFTWTFTWTWEVQLQLPWILQVNSFRILPRSAYRAQKENPVIRRITGFSHKRSVFSGGGGSRTRVQTGNPKAFYTLSRHLILLPVPGRQLPNTRPSSLIFAHRPEPSGALSLNGWYPVWRAVKERNVPSGYSSPKRLGFGD